MAIGLIKVHAGDFSGGMLTKTYFTMRPILKMRVAGANSWEQMSLSEIAEIEVASEESVKRLGGTIGWGIVGNALLGPVGLLAGLIEGGKGKDVTFICTFNDGRKFLGTTSSSVYTQFRAARFTAEHRHTLRTPTTKVSVQDTTTSPSKLSIHPRKNRIVAIALALMLGGIGAHKFYLGQPMWGILYLAFCWTLVPSLVGFVEGLGYLFTSEEIFLSRYGEHA
jgi:hypothetical protein